MVDIKNVISEAVSTHMNAVHYSPHKGSHKQFKIHKVGANFQKHVKPGDVVPSSAIDDLADAGAKLKQIKEDTETVDEAMSHITKTPMVASRPGRETSRVSSTAVDVGGGRKMEMSAKGPKDAARSTYHPASQAKPKGKLPEEVEVEEERSHITKTPMVASRPGRETSRVSSTAVDIGGGRKMEMSAKGPKDAARSTYHPASQAKPKGKLPEEVEDLDESTHMAVHVYPTTKAHTSFKVHKVGAGVKHVKVGDTVSSSDLDDLSDAGHKVKEVKAPQ